MSWQLTAV